jgi:hypothetical protein
MRDRSASIVVIAGANSDGNNVRKLADEPCDFTRSFHPGLGREHVQQITGNANEVVTRSLFEQSSKPVKPEMKVGGNKEFHALTENPFSKSPKFHPL